MEGAHLLSHCTSPWRVGLEFVTTRLRPTPTPQKIQTSRDKLSLHEGLCRSWPGILTPAFAVP